MKPTYHRKSYFFQTHFFQLKIKQRERENHVLEKDKYTHMGKSCVPKLIMMKHRLTDDVVLWAEWINNSLVPVTSEPLNDYLHQTTAVTTHICRSMYDTCRQKASASRDRLAMDSSANAKSII